MSEQVQGTIHVANEVLADLAGFAALESYGIVGMASPTLRNGVAQLLSRDKLRKGVVIRSAEDGVHIDLFVIIEHGTNLAEVSRNLIERVGYTLRANADVDPTSIEVHVQGINVHK